jgi:hypothetical protein
MFLLHRGWVESSGDRIEEVHEDTDKDSERKDKRKAIVQQSQNEI